MAIFDRNVVSRCGAGCILKPGVRARVAVAILNRNVVFRCGPKKKGALRKSSAAESEPLLSALDDDACLLVDS